MLGRYLVSPPPTRIENSAAESWCFEWLVDDHRHYTFRYQKGGVWQEIAIPALPQDPRLVQRAALEGLYVAGHAVGRIVQLHLNLAYQQGGIPIERDTLGGTTVMWFSLSHPLYRTTLHEDANYYYIKLYDAAGAELPPNTPINTYLTLHILNERG